MHAAPVPVSVHCGTNEIGVIGLRRVILVESTGLDVVGGRSDGSSSEQSSEDHERLHIVDAALRCEQGVCTDKCLRV